MKKDNEKIITELNPDRPVTERVETVMPETLKMIFAAKPSSYYVLNWVENLII